MTLTSKLCPAHGCGCCQISRFWKLGVFQYSSGFVLRGLIAPTEGASL